MGLYSLFVAVLLSIGLSQLVSPLVSADEEKLYLRAAEGQLDYFCPDDFCEYYFHVPIVYGTQVPVLLTVEAEDLIDYRFIHMENNNILCVARMAQGNGMLHWVSYVMVERNLWVDIPDSVEMPEPGSLPDSVTRWLQSTDCCQLNSEYVAAAVQETGAGITNVIELADSIEDYVFDIPSGFPHSPTSFDAHYAIRWGNSCTGHAHAAAALFRGNGIPSRSLMVVPTIYSIWFDHHWIVDYFIPDYGWVMAESGNPTAPPRNFLVTFVVEPHQEFTKWFSNAIDGLWHSSSPSIASADWGKGHRGFAVSHGTYDEILIEQAMAVGTELWHLHTLNTGLILTLSEAEHRTDAVSAMTQAFEAINCGDIESYITHAEAAVSHYEAITAGAMEIFYSEDFEGGPAGWTHGGKEDTWELGSPLTGPQSAYSGSNCWGTSLSSNYSDNSECWLLSPVVDLNDRSNAELSFWLWNDIEDLGWAEPDKFFVEISSVDDSEFTPLSDCIKGLNNDPEIVAVGGWTRVFLDLRRYIGEQVQFRFKLTSNDQNTFPGAYIDDVQISGRYKDLTGIAGEDNLYGISLACSPNPCLNSTSLNITLPTDGHVSVAVYDITGRKVAEPVQGIMNAGVVSIIWDRSDSSGRQLPGGVYFVRVSTESECTTGKLVIVSQ